MRIAAGLFAIAVLVGRVAPGPAVPDAAGPIVSRVPRVPAHPRYVGLADSIFAEHSESARLLDTETGAVTTLAVPGTEGFEALGCSPWRDDAGQYHLIGRWSDPAGRRAGGGGGDPRFGLCRCMFPSGRVIDRIALEGASVMAVSWSPDRSDRVLFVTSDGGLHVHDLPKDRGAGGADPKRPRAVLWRARKPGDGDVLVGELCWPSVPGLAGRLLVVAWWKESRTQVRFSHHLFWLELSPDGGSIVAAERAIVAAERAIVAAGLVPSRAPIEESRPGVGVGRDGTPLLAFVAREEGRVDWDLWVMPIAPAAAGRGPRVRAAEARKVAAGCSAAVPAAFSADGRWVYAALATDERGRCRVERFALDAGEAPGDRQVHRRRIEADPGVSRGRTGDRPSPVRVAYRP
jgi:hypothetical protein